MSAFAGGALRLIATALYAIEFCCAAIVLGIYSYFLAVLSNHHLPIDKQWKAVEGISGIAVLYTIFAVLLTCFLGGISFFAFLAITLDVLFAGAFVALTVLTRHGSEKCSGNVNTPLGSGNTATPGQGFGSNGFGTGNGEAVTYIPNLGYACRLNSASFAVSIVGIVLFFISAALQVWVARHHRKEKKYGPSPANNYTSGYGKRKFWQRKNKSAPGTFTKDAEAAPVVSGGAGTGGGLAAGPVYDERPSAETGYTGTTQTQGNQYGGANNKYETHTGYHTGPTGTSVNPYGYDNAMRGTASNF